MGFPHISPPADLLAATSAGAAGGSNAAGAARHICPLAAAPTQKVDTAATQMPSESPLPSGRGGWGVNSIYLVFPIKGIMEPQMEISRGRNPPSPNPIFKGVGFPSDPGNKLGVSVYSEFSPFLSEESTQQKGKIGCNWGMGLLFTHILMWKKWILWRSPLGIAFEVKVTTE